MLAIRDIKRLFLEYRDLMDTMGTRYKMDVQVSVSVAAPWRRKCSNYIRSPVQLMCWQNERELCMDVYS